MPDLTDTERMEAGKALMRWFDSQSIMPPDAALVMIEVLATCLVDKAKDIDQLQGACETFKAGLVINVALMLKGAYP